MAYKADSPNARKKTYPLKRLLLDLDDKINQGNNPGAWETGQRYVDPWIRRGLANRLWRVAERYRKQDASSEAKP